MIKSKNRETDRIKTLLISLGADDCGLVSLGEQPSTPWHIRANDVLPGVKTVIVFCRKFPRYLYDACETELYNKEFYNMISSVDLISQTLAGEIKAAGYHAMAVAADDETEPDMGAISLRHYAVLAGLGSMGKNNLLLTPRFGSMVELGAVLTDMPLWGDVPIEKEICISGCTRCLQVCPQKALGAGVTKIDLCKETVYINENGDSVSGCWLCRSSCPVNLSLAKNQHIGGKSENSKHKD